MAITSTEEWENKKLYTEIRPGNRGGWANFSWESVRQTPYLDREMYMGHSTKIGVLDKFKKFRKKDWYLHPTKHLDPADREREFAEAKRKDEARIDAYFNRTETESPTKLTPQEQQTLLTRLRMLDAGTLQASEATGVGFTRTPFDFKANPGAPLQQPSAFSSSRFDPPNLQQPSNGERASRQAIPASEKFLRLEQFDRPHDKRAKEKRLPKDEATSRERSRSR